MTAEISFEKVNASHRDIIFQWLAEPHVVEFWDNSQEHKDDIINFIDGRQHPSNYFGGIFTYWVGLLGGEPFCFLLTGEVKADEECPQIWKEHLSTTGHTYTIDFCIGNSKYLGKGLAAPTLEAFTSFFVRDVNPRVDTFFIDPDADNPRAKHVYAKAGFKDVGEFTAEKKYWDFTGDKTYLMVKKI